MEKLPKEWTQMFRIILSIYLAWVILLSPKKYTYNGDSFYLRIILITLIFLFGYSDITSGLLLLLIYFFSFQPILPMENENENENFKDRPISQMINDNLKRGFIPPEPTQPAPISYNFKKAYDLNGKLGLK
jgi:hypothetical protein